MSLLPTCNTTLDLFSSDAWARYTVTFHLFRKEICNLRFDNRTVKKPSPELHIWRTIRVRDGLLGWRAAVRYQITVSHVKLLLPRRHGEPNWACGELNLVDTRGGMDSCLGERI
jgi:hypothetical protein